MAAEDDRLEQARRRIEAAEGYVSDAEFREEHESRLIRYLQATSNALIAVHLQNQVIIDLLKEQESGALSGG